MTIKIVQGIYDVLLAQVYWRTPDKSEVIFPPKFMDLLREKAIKWRWKFNYELILFTFGFDDRWKIAAIAILHPLDKTKHKTQTGTNIVKGRLARQRGEFHSRGRWEYNRLIGIKVGGEPPYMICHEIDIGDKTIIQQEAQEL